MAFGLRHDTPTRTVDQVDAELVSLAADLRAAELQGTEYVAQRIRQRIDTRLEERHRITAAGDG